MKKLKTILLQLKVISLSILSALVTPFFKEPVLSAIGIAAILAFGWNIQDDLTGFVSAVTQKKIIEYFKNIEAMKIFGEVLQAITSYFLFFKKAFAAWKQRLEFREILSEQVSICRAKLDSVRANVPNQDDIVEFLAPGLQPRWSKLESFDEVESVFVERLVSYCFPQFTQGRKLFAQLLLLDLYPVSKPRFLSFVSILPLSDGSPKHEFLTLVHTTAADISSFDLHGIVNRMPLEAARNLMETLMKGNLDFYARSLNEKFSKEALIAAAEQLLKKGYTTIDNLIRHRRQNKPLKMLIKYGEDFTYWEQKLRTKINNRFSETRAAPLLKSVQAILHPQPFSKAIFQHSRELIQLLPKDPFVFVFNMEVIFLRHKIKSPVTFMRNKIIPAAEENHNGMLSQLKSLDKQLNDVTKPFVKNYYIINMDLESVLVHAGAKSVPEGLRRVLVHEVAERGNFATLMASQNLYIKQIIQTLPPASLLEIMNADVMIIDFFERFNSKIRGALGKVKLYVRSTSDIKEINRKPKVAAKALFSVTRAAKYKGPLVTMAQCEDAINMLMEAAEKLDHLVQKGFATDPARRNVA